MRALVRDSHVCDDNETYQRTAERNGCVIGRFVELGFGADSHALLTCGEPMTSPTFLSVLSRVRSLSSCTSSFACLSPVLCIRILERASSYSVQTNKENQHLRHVFRFSPFLRRFDSDRPYEQNFSSLFSVQPLVRDSGPDLARLVRQGPSGIRSYFTAGKYEIAWSTRCPSTCSGEGRGTSAIDRDNGGI